MDKLLTQDIVIGNRLKREAPDVFEGFEIDIVKISARLIS